MKIIMVSHGDFSKGLLNSVQMLVGEQEDLVAYGLYPQEDREVLQKKIQGELEQKTAGEEVLLLSDIFHGTPFNVGVELMEHYDFYHITGINLSLLVEIIMERSLGKSAAQICENVMAQALSTIKDVRKLLEEAEEE